jgi:hypothetical protein
VQRLATIAHGDGVCTTHIPGPRAAGAPAVPAAGHTRAGNRSTPASPVPGERAAPPGPAGHRESAAHRSTPSSTTASPPSSSTRVRHRERTPA